jgi:two-component system OmpR family response regulator
MTKLLLIEDDSETAEEITAELADCGFVVEWASNGIEGLDKARSLRPDVMIVDRLLPGMDGLTVIEALRKDQMRTPVLVLSALGAVDDRVWEAMTISPSHSRSWNSSRGSRRCCAVRPNRVIGC